MILARVWMLFRVRAYIMHRRFLCPWHIFTLLRSFIDKKNLNFCGKILILLSISNVVSSILRLDENKRQLHEGSKRISSLVFQMKKFDIDLFLRTYNRNQLTFQEKQ